MKDHFCPYEFPVSPMSWIDKTLILLLIMQSFQNSSVRICGVYSWYLFYSTDLFTSVWLPYHLTYCVFIITLSNKYLPGIWCKKPSWATGDHLEQSKLTRGPCLWSAETSTAHTHSSDPLGCSAGFQVLLWTWSAPLPAFLGWKVAASRCTFWQVND